MVKQCNLVSTHIILAAIMLSRKNIFGMEIKVEKQIQVDQ